MLGFSDTVCGRIIDGVLVIEIDHPPVNALSVDVRAGLGAALAYGRDTSDVDAIIITGAGKLFVGGADIREIGQPPVEPILPDMVAVIEASAKPVVAAITGAAPGGGLEVALAVHQGIASPSATFAAPEVKLGIVPGAGGTQRLPRLIGLPAAIDLIATGRTVGSEEALKLGIVDRIEGGDLQAGVMDEARPLLGKPLRRTGECQISAVSPEAIDTAENKALVRARGQIAPREAVRPVRLAGKHALQDGLAEERATFLRLRDSEQATAPRHVFFAERAAAEVDGLDGIKPRDVQALGVPGMGLMGSSIATAALDAGFIVVGVEQGDDAAAKGRARIEALLDRAVQSGRIDADGRQERLTRLHTRADMTALKDTDLIIDAVFDDLDVKTKLFQRLDQIVRPDTILATNTYYLDPDRIAAATSRPERVLGLHFFSPANVMVEVVRCARTAPQVLATGVVFAKRLRKLPIVCGVTEGFVGNRLFSAYRRDAEFLLEDGALPHQIDAAMEEYGFAMGPFAVFDLAGLESAWARRKRQAATRDPTNDTSISQTACARRTASARRWDAAGISIGMASTPSTRRSQP